MTPQPMRSQTASICHERRSRALVSPTESHLTRTMPLITIGLTAFNAEATIGRAVDSAMAQTWPSLEIVIVDDGSTDGTPRIIDGFRDPRIRTFHHATNTGTGAARNTVIRQAHGEAIAFFDDDDTSDPVRIQAQWERLATYEARFANGAPVACYTARRVHYPSGDDLLHPTIATDPTTHGAHGPRLIRHLLTGAPLPGRTGEAPTCSQLARRSTFALLGGFDPTFRRQQDTEFNVRLARAGGHIIGIDEPLVRQTITPSPDKALTLERDMGLLLLAKHSDTFEGHHSYVASRHWLEAKYAWLRGDTKGAVHHLGLATLIDPKATSNRFGRALGSLKHHRAFRHSRASLD